MNTGAGDAVDLGWKLAGVLQGWGGSGLLDAYEEERRPIGARSVAASRRATSGRKRWRSAWRPEIDDDTPSGELARYDLAEVADREQRWSNDLLGIELGYSYRGSMLIIDEPGDGPDTESFEYTPSTWPGCRLPHLWLEDGSPLQDHLHRGFTLVTNGLADVDDGVLAAAFAHVGAPYGRMDVRSQASDVLFEGNLFLLVRPDLHVAWRGVDLPEDVEGLVARVSGWGRAGGPMTDGKTAVGVGVAGTASTAETEIQS